MNIRKACTFLVKIEKPLKTGSITIQISNESKLHSLLNAGNLFLLFLIVLLTDLMCGRALFWCLRGTVFIFLSLSHEVFHTDPLPQNIHCLFTCCTIIIFFIRLVKSLEFIDNKKFNILLPTQLEKTCHWENKNIQKLYSLFLFVLSGYN